VVKFKNFKIAESSVFIFSKLLSAIFRKIFRTFYNKISINYIHLKANARRRSRKDFLKKFESKFSRTSTCVGWNVETWLHL